MKLMIVVSLLCLASGPVSAHQSDGALYSAEFLQQVASLRDMAMDNQLAYQVTE